MFPVKGAVLLRTVCEGGTAVFALQILHIDSSVKEFRAALLCRNGTQNGKGCIVKNVLLGCLGAAIAGFLLLAVATFMFLRELPRLDANLKCPAAVELNSTIPLVVEATNNTEETIILDSIDISSSFLDGFQVVSIDPEPDETMLVPFSEMRTWSFGKEVDAGQSIEVTFKLKAVKEGHFSGDVDVCNPNQDFVTTLADIVVKTPEAP